MLISRTNKFLYLEVNSLSSKSLIISSFIFLLLFVALNQDLVFAQDATSSYQSETTSGIKTVLLSSDTPFPDDYRGRLIVENDGIVFVKSAPSKADSNLYKIDTNGVVKTIISKLPGQVIDIHKNKLNNSYVLKIIYLNAEASRASKKPNLIEVFEDGSTNIILEETDEHGKEIAFNDFIILNKDGTSEYYVSHHLRNGKNKIYKVVASNKLREVFSNKRLEGITSSPDDQKLIVSLQCSLISLSFTRSRVKVSQILDKTTKAAICNKNKVIEDFLVTDNGIFLSLKELLYGPEEFLGVLTNGKRISIKEERIFPNFHATADRLYFSSYNELNRLDLVRGDSSDKSSTILNSFSCFQYGQIASNSGDRLVLLGGTQSCEFSEDPGINVLIYQFPFFDTDPYSD